jgi:hypothetical protein
LEGGFCRFAFGRIDPDAAMTGGVRTDGSGTLPHVLFWNTLDYNEIRFVNPTVSEQASERIQGTTTLGEEQESGGLGVEAMGRSQVLNISGLSPESALGDTGLDGSLEIEWSILPGKGDEHPACGFIDNDNRTIFIDDR